MARLALLLAALSAAVVVQAFVPPAAPAQRQARATAPAPAAWLVDVPVQAEEDVAGASPLGPLAAGCALGAAAAWLGRRRRHLAAAGAAATGAAPLAAHAAGSENMLVESSVAVAGGEEALFYVFILFATLTTLVLAVVLREARVSERAEGGVEVSAHARACTLSGSPRARAGYMLPV
eukprot:CAMPEP_0175571806 /NCGR_PEP_ID=MMETSP0096-20121207/42691_1 /TAXON_ID=311494 /ORGANISM="Alexandrium monilatum, Strain CCMP3105" /LENGTH=177 /DNA_ID=CAMNT_0016875219 /DNA_START=76 /DNA_END=606 /DNA_ORIENTATION=+